MKEDGGVEAADLCFVNEEGGSEMKRKDRGEEVCLEVVEGGCNSMKR